MKKKLLEEYAKLAIIKGVNLQKDQELIINAPINASELVYACSELAYKLKAKRVTVNYQDDYLNRLHYMYQDEKTLMDIKKWMIKQKTSPLKEGACVLRIISDIPNILKDIDPAKINKALIARSKAFKEANEIMMTSKVSWSIIAYPNFKWAKKVFPKLSDEKALKKLETAILNSVYINGKDDPLVIWDQHEKSLSKRVEILNKYNFKSLHFINSLGTDLVVELAKKHNWAGGNEKNEDGVIFNANLPTEEVFGMPLKNGVSGKVFASKPLSYNGVLIEGFNLEFKDGKVIKYHADKNEDILKSLLEFDKGSSYLGEVALVDYHSPISLSNILFYETLFDENASCHLALGDSYPVNTINGNSLNRSELNRRGANHSNTHIDFMFGTSDLSVVGLTNSNKKVEIIKDGDFIL